MKPLFSKEKDVGLRLLVFVLLSLTLLFADYRFRQVDNLRSVLSTALSPIQFVVDMPSQLWNWANSISADIDKLRDENSELRTQELILQRKLQKMEALTVENIRLRELLEGRARVDEKVMVAEVIGTDPDPFTHELVINKGLNEGAYVGQPVLDAAGVMGQVLAVSRYTSRALLITDSRHAIPVEINRTGARAVAAGNGLFGHLDLLHLSATEDIEVGDLLVSSGLGGHFPAGYPVAVVDQVRRDPGQPFARVSALPAAQLNRSRQVLMVLAAESNVTLPNKTGETDKVDKTDEVKD